MPSTDQAEPLPVILKLGSIQISSSSPSWRAEPSFQVASCRKPPLGQKSQHSEQPVHILTSLGRSSSPTPMESVGQAATHTPHCTHLSASMTAFSRSQNQTLPGASSMSFISSLMSKPATANPV